MIFFYLGSYYDFFYQTSSYVKNSAHLEDKIRNAPNKILSLDVVSLSRKVPTD